MQRDTHTVGKVTEILGRAADEAIQNLSGWRGNEGHGHMAVSS